MHNGPGVMLPAATIMKIHKCVFAVYHESARRGDLIFRREKEERERLLAEEQERDMLKVCMAILALLAAHGSPQAPLPTAA